MNTKLKEIPGVANALQLITAGAKHYILWGLCFGVINALFGWLFEKSQLMQVLWFAIVAISFVKKVVIPTREDYKNAAYETTRPNHDLLVAPIQESVEPPRPTVSPETLAIRQLRSTDITACFADSAYRWHWANDETIDQVYAQPTALHRSAEGRKVSLNISNGRVTAAIVHEENVNIRLDNKALLYFAQQEKARKEAPIAAFLKANLPDAKWRTDGGEIILTSAAKGVENARGVLHYAEDASISFITIKTADGKMKYIRQKAAKKKVEKSAAHTPVSAQPVHSAQPAKIEASADFMRVNHSEFSSSIVATKAPEEPVDVLPTAEETLANLLRPTEAPPISDDDLKRAANLQADYDAMELCQLAMSAEQNGETNFIIRWPEGLQTKKEVEFYAEALVSRGGFRQVDINAENLTMRIHIQDTDEYTLDDYAPED